MSGCFWYLVVDALDVASTRPAGTAPRGALCVNRGNQARDGGAGVGGIPWTATDGRPGFGLAWVDVAWPGLAGGETVTAPNAARRVRVTTHMPMSGERIGLTVWFGSVEQGWKGWPVFKRGLVYTIKGVPADEWDADSFVERFQREHGETLRRLAEDGD